MNLEITLEGQLRRILEDEGIIESNKTDMLRYFEFSEARGVKVSTRISVAQKFRVIGQNLDKPFMEATKDDYARLINKVTKSKRYSESTFEKFKKAIKQLLRFLNNGRLPDNVFWIPTKNPKNRIQAKDLLTDEEVEELIRGAESIQLKAIITTLHETGARISELVNVKLEDIKIHENRIKIYVDGKTGKKTLWVIQNYNLLKTWLENHPNRESSSYLFSFSRDRTMKKPISGQNLNLKLKQIAAQRGIKKRIYNHLFRHTAATKLYKVNSTYAKEVLGHNQDSRMQGIYTHLDEQSTEDFLLGFHGIKQNKEKTEHICKRCKIILGLTERICPNCGLLKDGLAAEEWEKDVLTISKDNLDEVVELLVPRILNAISSR